jgi:hypothetical protein
MTSEKLTAALKAKVALEAIQGQKTVDEIAAEFDVDLNQVSAWKEQMLGGSSAVFDGEHACRGRSPEADRDGPSRLSSVTFVLIAVLVVIELTYAYYRISELPIIVCCTVVASTFAIALACSYFVSGARAVLVFLVGYLVILPCLGGAAGALDIGAKTLDCPPGTVPDGHVFPIGYTAWCKVKSTYNGNVRSGPYRQWWATGGPRTVGGYLDGKPHGMWTIWHANGLVYRKGAYDKGVKTGPWTWWENTGEKISEVVYVDGKPIRPGGK